MTDYTASSGQTATGLQLGPNDTLTVLPGGEAANTFSASYPEPENGRELGAYGQIYSGVGASIVNGGILLDTALNSSSEEILAGGISNGTTIGSLNAFNNFVNSVGNGLTASSEQVDAGGTANNTLAIFGTQTVMNGGVANNTVLYGLSRPSIYYSGTPGNGVQDVLSGGQAHGSTLDGGTLTVEAGGTSTDTVVNYGIESVTGIATGTTIFADGSQTVANGGQVNKTTVNGAALSVAAPVNVVTGSGTGLSILSGGSASQVLVENGGTLTDTGRAYATTVQGGLSQLVVSSGAFSDATVVSNGGRESVSGTETSPIVGYGSTLVVQGGGLVNAPTVQAGRTLTVLSGGTFDSGMQTFLVDTGAIINTGTLQIEPSLGVFYSSSQLAIGAGGMLTNSGLIITPSKSPSSSGGFIAGGSLVLQAGAAASNTGTIRTGTLDVEKGARLTNSGLLSGPTMVEGILALVSGASTSGPITGSSGGLLELTGSGGTLTGLGNTTAGYSSFATTQLDAGANWTLGSTNTLTAGSTLALGSGSTLTVGSGGVDGTSVGTLAFQGASTLDISLQGQTGSVGLSGFNVGSVINATNAQAGNTVFALGSNDATINLADGYSPFLVRFLGDSGRHLQLRESTSLLGTLTLEPVITSLAAHPGTTGSLTTGDVVTFNLTPETALTVQTAYGLPTLSLSDGGTATFDQVASTATDLVFRTTIAVGQASTDLKVTGMLLAGSFITDALGTTLDTSSVATLAGSDTGIVIPAPSTTPSATVSGGVTVIGGTAGTVFITPTAGSNSVTVTATGNDTVISQGRDTIQAGGGADVVYATGTAATVAGGTGSLTFEGSGGNYLVVGGSGSSAIYGGSGSDTFFGGTGSSILVAGSGANNLLLAGVGNTSLVGGLGKSVLMFGGPGADSFTGSGGGDDVMVGGAGGNSFSLTNEDVAFGGPIKADSFTAGNGAAMIITGGGGAQVNLGSGTLTSFEGSGAVNYNAGKGEGGNADIVGFTVHDHITLTGGFTAQDASTAFATATKGSFGTTLNLTDGTKITVFGVNLTATQVSAG